MAQKRMFSLRIVDSARYLQMPVSSRDLYFYLCMNADDDGIVEGYGVMRKLGAADDDWKVLVTKGFIKILKQEEQVWFIVDWLEHNLIRPDRKVNSLYKDLLIESVPEVKVIEPKQRSDVLGKYKTKKNNQPVEKPVAFVKSGEPGSRETNRKMLFYQLVKTLGFTDQIKATDGRLRKLTVRLKTYKASELVQAAKHISGDKFMQGDNESSKRYGTIDYLLRSDEVVDKWLNEAMQGKKETWF